MEKKQNISTYRKRLDTALDNRFLRQAMDKFAVAYRTSRENAFAQMDVDALVKQVAHVKAAAVAGHCRCTVPGPV